jgi:hypothetical protein
MDDWLAAFDDDALLDTTGADNRHLRRNDDQTGEAASDHAEVRRQRVAAASSPTTRRT